MTTSALRSAQQRAIVRAQAAKLVRLVEPITNSEWFVPSTSQPRTWYIVSRSRLGNSESWSCTCKGSRNGHPCMHQAAAWLYEQKLTVAGEPTPAAPLAGVARIGWTETPIDASEWAAIYGKRGAA